jgi:hypothetical protein
MRYIHVTYDNKCRVTEVCVSEVLTCKNLFHTENCIVSYDLHNWIAANHVSVIGKKHKLNL